MAERLQRCGGRDLHPCGLGGNDSALTTAEDRNYLGLSKNEEDLLGYLQSQKQAGVFSKIVAVINSDQAMELGWVDEYDVDAVCCPVCRAQSAGPALPM
mgnify:CR=1 FL=1